MCGVAGIVALRSSAPAPEWRVLESMAAALSHRGPDEFGLYRDHRAGLAHARLSIIDLASGKQPMSNARGTLWISYNGEIFNYVELRQELRALGHEFRTRSDTEVVLVAYEAWGARAFERFNGQWALAIWDSERERLVLSRDPAGILPLYVTEVGGRVHFASEVKALFRCPGVTRAIDPVGLGQVFTFWGPIAPRTVFAHVEELEPGHTRIYERGARSDVAQDLGFSSPTGSPRPLEESVEELKSSLERAVALRMVRSDVPVGSYLSGGLDSSLVAALGHAAIGSSFKTFSLRFSDAEFDETPYQRLVAAALGTEHHDVVVRRNDVASCFPRVIHHTERPVLRTAPAPMFLLSKLVQDHGIKVVLTGEGADEMFAGYDLFREGKVRRFWARHPASTMRPRLLERLYPYLSRSPVQKRALARQFFGAGLERAGAPGFAHEPRWRSTAALWRLFHRDIRACLRESDPVSDLLASVPSSFGTWSPLAQDQYLECRTLLSPYLLSSQGDRMLMAHSIEGRFPFLDRDVTALARVLPDSHKLRVLDEKHVLKRVARTVLPHEIVRRRKQPFRAPDAPCFFESDAPEWVGAAVSEASLVDAGLFDVAVVGRLLDKCRKNESGELSNTDNMAVVGILSTQLLFDAFIRTAPDAGPRLQLTVAVDRSRPASEAWGLESAVSRGTWI